MGDIYRKMALKATNTATKCLPLVLWPTEELERFVPVMEIRDEIVENVGILTHVPSLSTFEKVLGCDLTRDGFLLRRGEGIESEFAMTQLGESIRPLAASHIVSSEKMGFTYYRTYGYVSYETGNNSSGADVGRCPPFVNAEIMDIVSKNDGISPRDIIKELVKRRVLEDTDKKLNIVDDHISFLSEDRSGFPSLIAGYEGTLRRGNIRMTENGDKINEAVVIPDRFYCDGDESARAAMKGHLERLTDGTGQDLFSWDTESYLAVCPFSTGVNNEKIKMGILLSLYEEGSARIRELSQSIQIPEKRISVVVRELMKRGVVREANISGCSKNTVYYELGDNLSSYMRSKGTSARAIKGYSDFRRRQNHEKAVKNLLG